MPYFQIDLFFYLGRHVRLRFIHITAAMRRDVTEKREVPVFTRGRAT